MQGPGPQQPTEAVNKKGWGSNRRAWEGFQITLVGRQGNKGWFEPHQHGGKRNTSAGLEAGIQGLPGKVSAHAGPEPQLAVDLPCLMHVQATPM
jgi:hypothetical protein